MARPPETPHVGFPSTHWSVLAGLTEPGHPDFRRHLAALAERYWRPAYCFLRNLPGQTPDRALDLTQQFFASLLERGHLGSFAAAKGSFRSYLKAALRNLSVDEKRRERPGLGFRLDAADVEPPAPGLAPEAAFDRAWARQVICEAVDELRRFLEREWKSIYFDLFSEYYLEASGLELRRDADADPDDPVSYESLAARHRISTHDVGNHLRYARQAFAQILQRLAQEYLGGPADVAEELRFLLARP